MTQVEIQPQTNCISNQKYFRQYEIETGLIESYVGNMEGSKQADRLGPLDQAL